MPPILGTTTGIEVTTAVQGVRVPQDGHRRRVGINKNKKRVKRVHESGGHPDNGPMEQLGGLRSLPVR